MVEAAALTAAMTRLRAFRARFGDGEIVDQDSGLTASDLTAIIDRDAKLVSIPFLDFGNPDHVASMTRQGAGARGRSTAQEDGS